MQLLQSDQGGRREKGGTGGGGGGGEGGEGERKVTRPERIGGRAASWWCSNLGRILKIGTCRGGREPQRKGKKNRNLASFKEPFRVKMSRQGKNGKRNKTTWGRSKAEFP